MTIAGGDRSVEAAGAIATAVFASMIVVRLLPAPEIVPCADGGSTFADGFYGVRLVGYALCTCLGPFGFLLALLSSRRLAAREGRTTPRAITLFAAGSFTMVAGAVGAAWAPGYMKAGREADFVEYEFLPEASMIACCLPTAILAAAALFVLPVLAVSAFIVGRRSSPSSRWEAATYFLLLVSGGIVFDLLASWPSPQ